jgi:hypothetical protein
MDPVQDILPSGLTLRANSGFRTTEIAELRKPARPSLPLASSLELTLSYNVTIGIPIHFEIAKIVMKTFPIA